MLDSFRNWINMILAIGILFTVIRIIVPNTKLKKYIYSLMGIVTIIVILNPIISFFKDRDIASSIRNIVLNMTAVETVNDSYTNLSNYEDINKNNVKETFKNNIANDMEKKISENIENEVEVKIDITDAYDIEKVFVKVEGDTAYDIVSFINREYDIEKSKIEVTKGV